MSEDGQYLAGVSQDGHVKVWDLNASGEEIRDYETKGSFGTCIDLVNCEIHPFFRQLKLIRGCSPRMVDSLLAGMIWARVKSLSAYEV